MYDALAPAVDALEAGLATALDLADALDRAPSGRRRRARRDHPDAGPQGTRQLPRRAQRRPPGPGRDQRRAAGRRGRSGRPRSDARGHHHEFRPGRRHRRRLAQSGAGRGRARPGERDAARTPGPDRDRGRARRDDVRDRRRAGQAGHREGRRSGRRRRPDGPRQRGAQCRARPRPARRPRHARPRDALSSAPIVEGLVVAAVAASGGASRSEVATEARNALLGKAAHLSVPDEAASEEPAVAATEEVVGVFTVDNRHGLHARPAARLVGEVGGLDATVTLDEHHDRRRTRAGRSLSRVATLGAQQRSSRWRSRASGPQAQEAVEHVLALAARHFDETDAVRPGGGRRLRTGRSPRRRASPSGPSVGSPSRRSRSTRPRSATQRPNGDVWSEAVAEVRRDTEHLRALTVREVGEAEAGIFDAHLSLLADSEMLADVKHRIGTGLGAFTAWSACLTEIEQEWSGSPTPTSASARPTSAPSATRYAACSRAPPSSRPWARAVLVARDLTPAQAARLDTSSVRGILLAAGSASSHAAILARSRDIPLVVSAGREVLSCPGGHPDRHRRVARARSTSTRTQRWWRTTGAGPPTSRNGVPATSRGPANPRPRSTARASWSRPTSVRWRTPGPRSPPAQTKRALCAPSSCSSDAARLRAIEEQEDEYVAIGEALGGRRATLRTLDVGGDKPLPYLPVPPEDNPFLGLRGLRLALERPALLRRPAGSDLPGSSSRADQRDVPDGVDASELRRARRSARCRRPARDGLPDGSPRRDDGRGACRRAEDRVLPAACSTSSASAPTT